MINGGVGDDILIGGKKGDAIAGTDGLTQGDWLLGGDGDDIVSGSTGRDMLNGGAGDDTIEGGAGADIILGDANYDFKTSYGSSVMNGWPSMGIAPSQSFAADHVLHDDGSDTITAQGAVTQYPSTAFTFKSDTTGADFAFTPTTARTKEQCQRLAEHGGDAQNKNPMNMAWRVNCFLDNIVCLENQRSRVYRTKEQKSGIRRFHRLAQIKSGGLDLRQSV